MAEQSSINLLLASGKGYNLSYLLQGREVDKSNHEVARSICMVPIDKIAFIDDMTKRVKSGELEIKVKRK